MSKFDHSSLLKFLNDPHCLHDIIGHFEVPAKLVNYHLQEAIRSGEIIVYKKQMHPEFMDLEAKQLRLKGVLYVSRDSQLHPQDPVKKNSLPKTRSSATRELPNCNRASSVFSHKKPLFLRNFMAYLKGKTELSGALHSLSDKMKLATGNRSTRRLIWEKRHDSSESRSLLHIEKLRLFRALSNKPLPFLDIHRRFGISKQFVRGFVKRGLFEEVWGPKDIGVKFKLTEKGEVYLKRLENASHFESHQRKKIFIRLKHRIPS